MAKMVKNLPAIQKTWVLSLGQEDPLEKGMVTHSGILAWKIPQTEVPGGLQSVGSQSQTRQSMLPRMHLLCEDILPCLTLSSMAPFHSR